MSEPDDALPDRLDTAADYMRDLARHIGSCETCSRNDLSRWSALLVDAAAALRGFEFAIAIESAAVALRAMRDRAPRKIALLVKLAACAQSGDLEIAHSEADDALLDYIADDEIRVAYDEIDKWYA